MADDDGDRRLSFSLPPISLPPLFPDRFTIRLPVPGFRSGRELSTGWTLLVVLGFDLFDAVLALTAAAPLGGPVGLVRTAGGTLLAVTLASGVGLVYAWELVAVLGGIGAVTAVPTLSVCLLWTLSRKGGHALSDT